MTNLDGILWKIAKEDVALTKTEIRVLLCLYHFTERRNRVVKTQKFMAEQLGISCSDFSKALKRLMELELAVYMKVSGERRFIHVSPLDMWHGLADQHDAHIDRFVKKITMDARKKAA